MDLGRGFAGLMAGVGKGLVEDAAAQREANLKRLEQQFRREEAAADRNFRAGESAQDRDFRAGESAQDRAQRLELAQMSEAGATRRAGMAAGSAAAGRASARELALMQMEHTEDLARLNAELRSAELAEARAYESGNAEETRKHQENIERLRAELAGEARKETQGFSAEQAELERGFRRDESKAEYERRTGLQISQQEFVAGQAELDRGFRADEGMLDRRQQRELLSTQQGFTGEQNAEDRNLRRELDANNGQAVPSATGGFYNLRGSTATPIQTPSGEPFQPAAPPVDRNEQVKTFSETMKTMVEAGTPPEQAMDQALRLSGLPFGVFEGAMYPVMSSPEEAKKLPKGSMFIANGQLRQVP